MNQNGAISVRPGAKIRMWLRRGVVVLALVLISAGVYWWWTRPVPRPPTEIFRGVTYECRRLTTAPEGSGLAHLLTVDLTTPGVELFVPPKDPAAEAAGWEYVTRWLPSAAAEQRLSVAINGCLFVTQSGGRMPGDRARSVETMVAARQVNHVWEHTYLLWFADDLTPHLEERKPPSPEALRQARWALGGQAVIYWHGRYNEAVPRTADRRTMIGIDPASKRLFLGVFDHASMHRAAEVLASIGATEVTHLDGGTSTGLVLGPGARGVRAGTYVYPLRAVPTFFGVRAQRK